MNNISTIQRVLAATLPAHGKGKGATTKSCLACLFLALTLDAAPTARLMTLPLSFEANRGQAPPEVKFVGRANEYLVFLTSTEAVFTFRSSGGTLRMKLAGARAPATITGLGELPGRSHYLIGNDPDKWRTNIPHYRRVRYANVYPGVDLVYYGNQAQLEYDLVVRPGGSPEVIALAFEGAGTMDVDARGELLLETAGGCFRMHRPAIYQMVGDERREVAGAYIIKGKHQVGFRVHEYDPNLPLVVDPVLSYATYLGGRDATGLKAVAVDKEGNAVVVGSTASTDFPTTPGALQGKSSEGWFDAVVAKLNADGSGLVFATYLGGSGVDNANAVALDNEGNVFVAGYTRSANLPIVNAFQDKLAGRVGDAFVAKLSGDGSRLVYSTYLGGDGDDVAMGIAVDSGGNAFVTGGLGEGSVMNFPTVNALQATPGLAFVAKLNPEGSALVYSTMLGRGDRESGTAIAVDASGNAYVCGTTNAFEFPVVNPLQATTRGFEQAFVSKINPEGSALVYSTYLGGGGRDRCNAIAVDSAGSAYVGGFTSGSTDFPTVNAIQAQLRGGSDGWLAKINPEGSALVFSTYLGGNSDDAVTGIAVDPDANVYATVTASLGFPSLLPMLPSDRSGVFLTKLNPEGTALVFSTWAGFSEGGSIALDAAGSIYLAGNGIARGLPTTPKAFQPERPPDQAGFVVKVTQP